MRPQWPAGEDGRLDFDRRLRTHAALSDPHRLAAVDLLALGDLTATDLATRLGIPGNLLAHHLNVLEEAGLVDRRPSEGDARRRYIVLRRTAHEGLGVGLGMGTAPVPGHIAFVCTHNSARSQFASALWRQRTGQPAESAGRTPAPHIHPMAVSVGAEIGLDLTGDRPRGYDELTQRPDMVVSVCDRTAEETLPDADVHLHWSVPDPVRHGDIGAFRDALTEIAARIGVLAGEGR